MCEIQVASKLAFPLEYFIHSYITGNTDKHCIPVFCPLSSHAFTGIILAFFFSLLVIHSTSTQGLNILTMLVTGFIFLRKDALRLNRGEQAGTGANVDAVKNLQLRGVLIPQ